MLPILRRRLAAAWQNAFELSGYQVSLQGKDCVPGHKRLDGHADRLGALELM
ncbi:hypothetical protein COCSUDRAFT_31941 [Coccomyxa subellipsoidea C-169]|uniref:Uncharacterized protein n=1 Tax=Coccomyxa subellipsoidea (strain C-169) TaxID=574566 RepID=I0Z950_COCSC|nr:hypothetical protein COCSUDRAFT_31941 [Coccomyxa subellipsoidea C-169]EIE27169.1 hypothetical protein COCSUDRAFT_31941 [Coccomyxa subellipsoidea C-169]|eukprot:XP_005651713.1 hypothetical protein COCSUDRAFT_31941 [Coccomyxa subellipsoidea C-169]